MFVKGFGVGNFFKYLNFASGERSYEINKSEELLINFNVLYLCLCICLFFKESTIVVHHIPDMLTGHSLVVQAEEHYVHHDLHSCKQSLVFMLKAGIAPRLK